MTGFVDGDNVESLLEIELAVLAKTKADFVDEIPSDCMPFKSSATECTQWI